MAEHDAPVAKRHRTRRWAGVGVSLLAVFVGSVVVCETMGWPFLAGPLQRQLSSALDRRVMFAETAGDKSSVRVHFFGSVRVDAPYIEIGAPVWSNAAHMLLAREAHLVLGYGDLWRAYRGGALVIRELKASQLDAELERLADGRASWTFGAKPPVDPSSKPARMPSFDRLEVASGALVYRDAPLAVDTEARFSLVDGKDAASALRADAASTAPAGTAGPSSSASAVPAGLQLHATGHYRSFPVKVELSSPALLPLLAPDGSDVTMAVKLNAVIGRAKVDFDGSTTDALKLETLKGRFSVQGPSLAAVGDPLGVTLPTTGAFSTRGAIAKRGKTWNAVFDQATIGSSHLKGAFVYDASRPVPLLSGRLVGSRVLLADLGPAVGGKAADTPAIPATATATRVRVLPDRPFDLPALRVMDANVLIDFADLDLGTALLQPLQPLRTHLVLQDGVLHLNDIDARTADGRLGGEVQLDGRNPTALWKADLNWQDVKLERWVHQTRSDGAPPYISGRLNGLAKVSGEGKSTAAILGSMGGTVRMHLLDGSISHLAVEAAGIDVAQALGMLIKGDDALPLQCTAVDLVAEKGQLRPRVLVLDTTDSTMWIDGSLSLATEALDLRVVVTPKDFSPLSLRTPVHVQGTFSAPKVSLEASKLAPKLGMAALLALVNPFAAIVPLIDTGDSEAANRGQAACESLRERIGSRVPAVAAKHGG